MSRKRAITFGLLATFALPLLAGCGVTQMEQAGYLDFACANADDPAKCKEDGLKAHREKRKEVLGF